jgi:hypothetical protein
MWVMRYTGSSTYRGTSSQPKLARLREGVTDPIKWNLGAEKPTRPSQTKLGEHETDGNLGHMIHGQNMPE